MLTSCSSTTPLSSIRSRASITSSYPGDLLARAIRNGLAVYAAHTSYDAAPAGVSVALARTLGLRGPLRVLSPRGALRKLVVFVPEENVDAVAKALAEAGAGVIGDYTECTFRTRGTGTFRGGEDADPYLGEKGRLEKVEEVRIETVVPAHTAGRAAEAATAAHPYEEMALDVYPVEGSPEGCGYGRAGDSAGAADGRGAARTRLGVAGLPFTPRRRPGTADRDRRRSRGIRRLLYPRSSRLGRSCLRDRGRRLPRRVACGVARPDRDRRRTRRHGAAFAGAARPAPRGDGRRARGGQPGETLDAVCVRTHIKRLQVSALAHETLELFLGWQGAHGAVVGAGEGAGGAAPEGRLAHPVFFQRSV